MKNLAKKLLPAVALLALSTLPELAAAPRKVAFRTLCLEQVRGVQSVVIPAADPTKDQKIELYTDISPVIEGTFQDDIARFYIEKGTGPDGKPLRELVGQTPIGKSERQLFLFLPGEAGEGKPPYQVRGFDDDTRSFAMGGVRAINLSPVPVRFMLSGEVTPQIPPAKFALFPHPKDVNDYNMYPVVVEFLSGNGQWVNGQSTSWKSTDRRRDIVITLVDPKFKQPDVRMFSDFPPWMEAIGKAAN